MSMTLKIPDNIGLNEKETKRFLAAKLYESGKLSLKRYQKQILDSARNYFRQF